MCGFVQTFPLSQPISHIEERNYLNCGRQEQSACDSLVYERGQDHYKYTYEGRGREQGDSPGRGVVGEVWCERDGNSST